MNPCCRRAPRLLPFLLSGSRSPNSNPNFHPHTLLLMRNMRAICRPYSVISSFIGCCRSQARLGLVSPGRKPNFNPPRPASAPANPFLFDELSRVSPLFRGTTRRTLTRVAKWDSEKSPYETLELERDADDEKIKAAYRRLAKYYHPDVYDGRGTLEEGETAESRFIKIQAAYELLIDDEARQEYDRNHRVNPLKASQAWMEWLMKKRKAFDQRGDMAVAAWAEQQQRELNVRVRRLSRSKMDPDEERRILAKEKKASLESFNTTLKRHTLVLKKREIMRRKAEEDKKKFINQLLAAEGLELESDEDDEPAREQSKDA